MEVSQNGGGTTNHPKLEHFSIETHGDDWGSSMVHDPILLDWDFPEQEPSSYWDTSMAIETPHV